MSQVRSSSILVHMQKGVSILCRVDHFANTPNTFGGCADLNLHRHKKQGVPWIAFRFRHGFRLRLSTEREISTWKHEGGKSPCFPWSYSAVVQFYSKTDALRSDIINHPSNKTTIH